MFTDEAVALPLKKRVLRGRRLVVVDIENVVGGAVLSVEKAVSARRSIEATIAMGATDQVVIGTSHIGVLAVGLGWLGARIVVRSGEDGADLALLDVLEHEHIPDRFDEVALVSGDGIFANTVAVLEGMGVDVTVVAYESGCSARLRLAAGRTSYLSDRAAIVGGVA